MVSWTGLMVGIVLAIVALFLITLTPGFPDELGVGGLSIWTILNALTDKTSRIRQSSTGRVFSD